MFVARNDAGGAAPDGAFDELVVVRVRFDDAQIIIDDYEVNVLPAFEEVEQFPQFGLPRQAHAGENFQVLGEYLLTKAEGDPAALPQVYDLTRSTIGTQEGGNEYVRIDDYLHREARVSRMIRSTSLALTPFFCALAPIRSQRSSTT